MNNGSEQDLPGVKPNITSGSRPLSLHAAINFLYIADAATCAPYEALSKVLGHAAQILYYGCATAALVGMHAVMVLVRAFGLSDGDSVVAMLCCAYALTHAMAQQVVPSRLVEWLHGSAAMHFLNGKCCRLR
jgi:hypothetical protein